MPNIVPPYRISHASWCYLCAEHFGGLPMASALSIPELSWGEMFRVVFLHLKTVSPPYLDEFSPRVSRNVVWLQVGLEPPLNYGYNHHEP